MTRPDQTRARLTSIDALGGTAIALSELDPSEFVTARTTSSPSSGAAATSSGDVNITQLRGALPPRPPVLAVTPVVRRVRLTVETAVRTGRIATISGPVGTGKSTAVAEAGRHLSVPVAYILMQDVPSVRAALEIIWESITRTPALGTEKQIKDDILRHLLRHDLALLIDDAHYVSTRGLRVLTSIWNALDATRARGVTIVFVGNSLNSAFTGVPEIRSRVVSRFEVPPLGGESLYTALAQIEPRTATTDMDVLRKLDREHFHGELRQWVQFLEVIRVQRPDATPDEPLSADEVWQALVRQGWS